MDVLTNKDEFINQISIFKDKDNFCYWNIGTPVFSDIINFYKRLIVNREAVDLYYAELYVNKYLYEEEDMYSLRTKGGINFAPNDFMKDDKTYFKLGAMRQYIQILLSFGLITCNSDVRKMSGIDLLKTNFEDKRIVYRINPIILSFLDDKGNNVEGFTRLCFDLLKINSKLGIQWAESLAYSVLITYASQNIDDKEELLENIPGQKHKVISESINNFNKYSIKNGFVKISYLIDEYSKSEWTENTADFIMEVLPYEQ